MKCAPVPRRQATLSLIRISVEEIRNSEGKQILHCHTCEVFIYMGKMCFVSGGSKLDHDSRSVDTPGNKSCYQSALVVKSLMYPHIWLFRLREFFKLLPRLISVSGLVVTARQVLSLLRTYSATLEVTRPAKVR